MRVKSSEIEKQALKWRSERRAAGVFENSLSGFSYRKGGCVCVCVFHQPREDVENRTEYNVSGFSYQEVGRAIYISTLIVH